MTPAWKINVAAGVAVIAIGVYSYAGNPDRPMSALLGPLFGLMLVLMTDALRKGRRRALPVAFTLTLLFGLLTAYIAFTAGSIEDPERRIRHVLGFTPMSLASFIAVGFHVRNYLSRRKASAAE